jgi:hypothetical protein
MMTKTIGHFAYINHQNGHYMPSRLDATYYPTALRATTETETITPIAPRYHMVCFIYFILLMHYLKFRFHHDDDDQPLQPPNGHLLTPTCQATSMRLTTQRCVE